MEKEIKIPIFMYHEIDDISRQNTNKRKLQYSYVTDIKQFKKQMKYLKERGFETLSIDDLKNLLKKNNKSFSYKEKKYIVLTFDDGFLGNYVNAFPILKEFNFTGNFFLITGRIDKKEMMT